MNRYGQKPYVYKLIHKDTGQFYIGYREGNRVEASLDLGIKYKTSSIIIKEMGFDNFKKEIIAEFENGIDAYDFENNLISEHFDNELCLNQHYRKTNGEKRFRCDAEVGKKIALSNTGRKLTKEWKEKVKNYWNDSARELQRQRRLGTKMTEEARHKMSESQRKRPPMTNETKARIAKTRLSKTYSPLSAEGKKAISDAAKRTGVCPHCGKEVTINNLKRWHMNNCKENKL